MKFMTALTRILTLRRRKSIRSQRMAEEEAKEKHPKGYTGNEPTNKPND